MMVRAAYACSVCSLFLCLSPPAYAAEASKIINPADIIGLSAVDGAQISPDGASIVYVVDGGSGSALWRVPSSGKTSASPVAAGVPSPWSPEWSPDGRSIAFLARVPTAPAGDGAAKFKVIGGDGLEAGGGTGAKPGAQIWTVASLGGKPVTLTDIAGNVRRFKWSGDGRYLAFLRRDPETRAEASARAGGRDQVIVDQNLKFTRLWVYELATHQARLITRGETNIVDFDWSPDSAEIAATVSPTPRTDDVENVLTVMTFDLASGKIDKVLPDKASTHAVHWSPDGRSLAFFKLAPTTDTGFPVLYDLIGGKETIVGGTTASTINDIAWNPDSRSLTALVLTGATLSIARADALSGELSDSKALKGSVEKISLSADGRTLAYVEETSDHPGEVYALSGGRERALTRTNPQVASWALGSEKVLNWSSSKDGRMISGVLLLPPHYDSAKTYKTIVHLHGGPASAWNLGFHGSWYDWGAVLASHGYVVLLPNPRGSDGGGTAFGMANDRAWGHAEFQDIMDGVDLLVARHIADPERLGVGGWSYGGFLTAWVVTHTDRFKVAIAGAAMTDLFSMATSTDIAPSFLTRFFGDLASNRQLYDAHSPARFLGNCHTPTLVMDGEQDARVPIAQGEAFYYGLRFTGRETEMVRYPREGHFFDEKPHQRDSLERMLAWYDAHLGG